VGVVYTFWCIYIKAIVTDAEWYTTSNGEMMAWTSFTSIHANTAPDVAVIAISKLANIDIATCATKGSSRACRPLYVIDLSRSASANSAVKC
jgi:hypothetical protein